MNFPILEIRQGAKEYPKLLAQIHDPPEQLYCRGNIELLHTFCFGVVGTRKLTAYGREATEKIVSELAGNNITIVSGLALGIDAVAHQIALDNDLPTIAVLGTGVDDNSIYPGTNLPLAQNILNNNGLIISEYPSGTRGYRSNFPARNRIVSGLSRGIFVVEALEKSGALITSKFATEQNRDVFALPGNIFAPGSKGPNMLIQKGAKPVFSADDILGNYYQNLELKLESKKDISTKNPTEKKILDILDEMGELTVDEVIRQSGLDASQTISTLSMLEINNKIKQRSGKYSCS